MQLAACGMHDGTPGSPRMTSAPPALSTPSRSEVSSSTSSARPSSPPRLLEPIALVLFIVPGLIYTWYALEHLIDDKRSYARVIAEGNGGTMR